MGIPPGPLPDHAEVPAVDHDGGVARLMGDAGLFARVLGRFRKEYRQAGAGIRAALDGGDLATAIRLAHTLKGAAGMIEALPLGREAQGLEQVLRQGGDPEPVLARLRAELERVLRELDTRAAALPQPPPPSGRAMPASRVQTGPDDAPERLAALLDEGNGDAVDLVRDAAPALAARLGRARYLQVAQAVESFDFDHALEMMRPYLPPEREASAG